MAEAIDATLGGRASHSSWVVAQPGLAESIAMLEQDLLAERAATDEDVSRLARPGPVPAPARGAPRPADRRPPALAALGPRCRAQRRARRLAADLAPRARPLARRPAAVRRRAAAGGRPGAPPGHTPRRHAHRPAGVDPPAG